MQAVQMFSYKLQEQGYFVMNTSLVGVSILYKLQQYVFRGIFCVDMTKNNRISLYQLEEIRKQVLFDVERNPGKFSGLQSEPVLEDIQLFTIVFSGTDDGGESLCRDNPAAWLVNTDSNALIIYEHQRRDFFHIRSSLEEVLDTLREEAHRAPKSPWQTFLYGKNGKRGAFVNLALVIINVLIFLLMDLKGDTTDGNYLIEWGASHPTRILAHYEYWRFFTQMFIHSGIDHLFSNMLTLFFLGDNLERAVGHWRYLCIYILSGLFASIQSFITQTVQGTWYVTMGASGAIFGVLGGLIFLLIKNKGKMEELRLPQMLFYVALALYSGFTSVGIDNAAHIGGLVAGFLATVLIGRSGRLGRRELE